MPSIPPSWRRRRAVSRSPDGSRTVVAEAADERADAVAVAGVALVVAAVALAHPRVRRAVDVVDRPADRRQPAGDERLAQPVGRE